MRAALLLALLAGPAHAEAVRTWGLASEGGPCRLTLERCPDADCYRLTFQNGLVSSYTDLAQVGLELHGFVVVVDFDTGLERIPDHMTVTPPPGWTAEPPELVVPDGAEGVVVLWPALLG